MRPTDTVADMLGGRNAELIRLHAEQAAEIRLRIGRELRITCLDGSEMSGDTVERECFHRLMNRLMENSLYAREGELRQGYFTTIDGCRVGVCGKMNAGRDSVENLANIASACIRIPRQMKGCAKRLHEALFHDGLSSVLIISPPGCGKTTMLRDLVRLVSDAGANVAVADERREIACCMEGVPQLDVGSRTDVLDGCPKALALPMLVRACAPDLLAADEIGDVGDAQALRDAVRCGVAVAATAHGRDVLDVLGREHIAVLLQGDVFQWCVLLGPGRGEIREIIDVQSLRSARM